MIFCNNCKHHIQYIDRKPLYGPSISDITPSISGDREEFLINCNCSTRPGLFLYDESNISGPITNGEIRMLELMRSKGTVAKEDIKMYIEYRASMNYTNSNKEIWSSGAYSFNLLM